MRDQWTVLVEVSASPKARSLEHRANSHSESGPDLAPAFAMDSQTSEERDEQTYVILASGFEVHRELGCGFLEQVYQDALGVEFMERDVPFEREAILRVPFKGRVLGSFYRPDFICFGSVIVEVKAQKDLGAVDLAQMINYLKVSHLARGLLLNFGDRSLMYRRVICSNPHSARRT